MPLTKGKFAIVDGDMFDYLSQWKWQYHCGYARRGKREPGKHYTVHMSHIVLGAKRGQQVDHINGDKLDNRKLNLRICSQAKNVLNTGKRSDNKSGFKGVSKYKNKWRACIQYNHNWRHIGYFDDIKKAAKAYDLFAEKLHGEYAKTNF